MRAGSITPNHHITRHTSPSLPPQMCFRRSARRRDEAFPIRPLPTPYRSTMIVIDHAPADWFLLCEGDRCWLDINGSISATGVSILLLLNASERALVRADPHAACATSASQVQARPHDRRQARACASTPMACERKYGGRLLRYANGDWRWG
ncbi:hypothetical protein XOCgx_4837 [Xanthomonas oryzae pv. oryzicola]|nr:hypothetical protein XOCgx_4837 [Xanthomonas oryzae pv. oryzicola]